MAYTNGTTHYNLPQTVGTDKRDWSDTNQAFADVDSALYTASQLADSLGTRVSTAESNISDLQTAETENTADITSLEGRMTSAERSILNNASNITDVKNDADNLVTAYVESTATASRSYDEGDYFIYNNVLYRATTTIETSASIVPNTNCVATNVSTELQSLLNTVGINSVTFTQGASETNQEFMTRIYNEFPTLPFKSISVRAYFGSPSNNYHFLPAIMEYSRGSRLVMWYFDYSTADFAPYFMSNLQCHVYHITASGTTVTDISSDTSEGRTLTIVY